MGIERPGAWLVALCLLALPARAAVTLEASRLSGPAPLAVLFDATGTAAPGGNTFHDLVYTFTFGDGPGTWPHSGKPRDRQVGGPIAAHVFEQPGTYTVKVEAGGSSATVQVRVDDPGKVYAGSRTICVGSAFDGCPQGAEQRSSLPALFDDRRVLLRRGDSFGTLTLRQGDQGVQVGAFGPGRDKPRVFAVSIGAGRPMSTRWPRDISVMDLSLADGVLQEGGVSRLLLLRLDLDGPAPANNRLHLSRAVGYWALEDTRRVVALDKFKVPSEIFVVDNRVVGNTTVKDTPLHNLTMSGARMAVMGNELSQAWEHNLRLYTAHKVFIAHNTIRGRSSDGGRHSIKLHSTGTGAHSDHLVDAAQRASSQIIIADNRFGDPADNNSWTVAVRPQSERYGEGIEDVIVENNRFVKGLRTGYDLVLVGRRMTSRGNSRSDGSPIVVHTHPGGAYPLPADWRGPYWIK
jgi:hypothetical protein